MVWISRHDYAAIYGPTAGDQIRLGDTDLWIEIEQDLTFGGEESVFGGGKSIRESMNQSEVTRAQGALDTVITNAVVLDHWGIVRADVGIRDGRIVGIGRSGNPAIADGVDPALVIGVSTDVISGEGKILTPGGFDSHVHFLSPSQITEALAAGLTTLGGGGTGPSEGSKATTVTPGAWHLKQTHRALDAFPVNLLLLGKGNTVSAAAFEAQALAGAGGYKLHEDWGSTPAAVDAALRGADEWGLQVALHSDSLNEAGFVASTIDAIAGRSISAFHVEGAGGGHAPDILTIAGAPQRAAGLDQPDPAAHRQHRRRAPRHADGLPPPQSGGPGGPGLRRVSDPGHHHRRRRSSARPRSDLDHFLGRASDGPDRRGDHPDLAGRAPHEVSARRTVRRTCRRTTSELGATSRSTRSIRPSATAIDHEIGSIEVGKLADLVLWDPRFFGISPSVVIKGGGIVVGALGDPNASIPTPQPVLLRPALYHPSGSRLSQTYVAPAALEAGLADELGLSRDLVAIRPTRNVGKADMVNNDALPDIGIDAETHRVTIDGSEIVPAPADRLPLAQLYKLF